MGGALQTSGAAVLAFLQERLGAIPLGLAEAPIEERQKRPLGPAVLPDAVVNALLLERSVVELSALPGAGAHSLALRLMAEGHRARPERWMCALVPQDGPVQLFAPATAGLSVPLTRLLVLTPPQKDLTRLAVRVTESGLFSSVLVDLSAARDLNKLPVAVRRLALRAEHTTTTVFLLTSTSARRRQALPVAARARVEPDVTNVENDDVTSAVRVPLLASLEKHRAGMRGTLEVPPMPDVLLPAYSTCTDPPRSTTQGKPVRKVKATKARGVRRRAQAALALKERAGGET